MLRSLRSTFASQLKDFAASPSRFEILHTGSSSSHKSRSATSLFVLDSSFNPPTKAHQRIAVSALRSHFSSVPAPPWREVRLLLLLATQNADKAPKPAAFEDRLVMMTLLADDVRDALRESGEGWGAVELDVDVAVTKEPYFHRKAAVVDESGAYPAPEGSSTQQVYLVGFDSLIRIFDGKYYGDAGFQTLQPFLSRHRLRVTARADDKWGSEAEQREYVEGIRRGDREGAGVNRDWGTRIDVVEGRRPAEGPVSSTEARGCVRDGDRPGLVKYVSERVAGWVWAQGLYQDAD